MKEVQQTISSMTKSGQGRGRLEGLLSIGDIEYEIETPIIIYEHNGIKYIIFPLRESDYEADNE